MDITERHMGRLAYKIFIVTLVFSVIHFQLSVIKVSLVFKKCLEFGFFFTQVNQILVMYVVSFLTASQFSRTLIEIRLMTDG